MHHKPTIQVQVQKITRETSAIKRFTLQALNGFEFPAFSGGSHIITYVNSLERQYSIFNISSVRGIVEIAVRLAEDSTGGSVYWHDRIQEGDVLEISFPKNYFPLSFQAKHHVFYAAGIGITPFLSMMSELASKNDSFELHYAAKSEEQCAFYQYLQKNYPDQCHFYFSNMGQRLVTSHLLEHRIGTHVYFCGPEKMIQEFTSAAKTYGYPSFNIHYERFAPPSKKQQQMFHVELKDSDRYLEVPANVSLLDVLLQHGVKIPYSCRVGGCGTCEVKVEEGEIVHFDLFLTEEQQRSNQTMLSCVSRGKGKLVLGI